MSLYCVRAPIVKVPVTKIRSYGFCPDTLSNFFFHVFCSFATIVELTFTHSSSLSSCCNYTHPTNRNLVSFDFHWPPGYFASQSMAGKSSKWLIAGPLVFLENRLLQYSHSLINSFYQFVLSFYFHKQKVTYFADNLGITNGGKSSFEYLLRVEDILQSVIQLQCASCYREPDYYQTRKTATFDRFFPRWTWISKVIFPSAPMAFYTLRYFWVK